MKNKSCNDIEKYIKRLIVKKLNVIIVIQILNYTYMISSFILYQVIQFLFNVKKAL